ncbi:MAG: hypothetical protein QM778_30540 [Myxococcales bacterium]
MSSLFARFVSSRAARLRPWPNRLGQLRVLGHALSVLPFSALLLIAASLAGCIGSKSEAAHRLDSGPIDIGEDGSLPLSDAGEDAATVDAAPPGSDAAHDAAQPDAAFPDGDAGDDAGDAAVPRSCNRHLPHVLVLFGGALGPNDPGTNNLLNLLNEQRLFYSSRPIDAEVAFQSEATGNFGAIVITDYEAYVELESAHKERLDAYARACDVGLYFLHVPAGTALQGGDLVAGFDSVLSNPRVDADSPVLRLTKDGGALSETLPGKGRPFVVTATRGYATIASATAGPMRSPNIVADDGTRDGVRKIFHGQDFTRYWLHDLLFLDGLQWLAPVELGIVDERWFAVDIDDIFMPAYDEDPSKQIVKLQRSDVDALIATQHAIAAITGMRFRFTLGFNSGFYERQLAPAPFDDVDGDHALVEHRDEFHWFDHLPEHESPTGESEEDLVALMQESKTWAEASGVIDYMTKYAVSPRHDGVAKRYKPLFDAWREVWDLRYTSAPLSGAGFAFDGVLVSPRLDLRIWSSQYSFDQVSPDDLDALAVAGGPVFRAMLTNLTSVFMTHQGNYARDRLAPRVLLAALQNLHTWTNLRFLNGTSDRVVEQYFMLQAKPVH